MSVINNVKSKKLVAKAVIPKERFLPPPPLL